MADFRAMVKELEEQRHHLLEQVSAIDRAIAALKGTDTRWLSSARVPIPAAPVDKPRRKRGFKLSDDHKQKLLEGQRRAREARRAAASDAGTAAPAGSKDPGLPRLVKRDAGS